MEAVAGPRRLPFTAIVRPYAILALFALVATGWRTPGATGAGTLRYFHLPMLAVIALAVGKASLLRRIEPLCIAFALYTLVYMAFCWYHGVPPYALQQGIYVGAGFGVASSLRVATQRDWRILRWTSPVAVVTFLVFFWVDARAAGVDVFGTLSYAARTGDINAIQFGLFQRVFSVHDPTGDFAVSALRGLLIAGLLVSAYLSMYAITKVGRRGVFFSICYWSAIALTLILVVVALARFLQLALVAGALLAVARVLVQNRARAGVVIAAALATTVFVLALTTGVVSLVYDRFTADTGSYDERGSALESALDAIFAHPISGSFTGGDAAALASGDRATLSAHNFVLDATIIGGLLTGVLALIVMLMIFSHIAKGIRQYLVDDRMFAPVAATTLTPIVMFSSGSGTLDMATVLGLGLFYGALTADRPPPADEDEPEESAQPPVGELVGAT